MSFNLVAGDMSIVQFIGTGNCSAGDMIKSNAKFAQFYAGHGWFGSLSTISVNQGYVVKCSRAQMLTVAGVPITIPSSFPILKGWTWLAAHFQATTQLAKFLSAKAAGGDILKSQTYFSSYYEAYGWFGQLTKLELGVAYKLKASLVGNVTFLSDTSVS